MNQLWSISILLFVLCAAFAVLWNCGDDDDDPGSSPGQAPDEDDDDTVDDDSVDDDAADDDATDDDATDDDATDDDDDDDDDNDDTTAETFNTDDGTMEHGFGFNVPGGVITKSYVPAAYPSLLTDISVCLSQQGAGHNYTIKVFTDASGGAPDDAVEVWSSGVLTDDVATYPAIEWLDFDLTAKGELPVLNAGSWVIAFINNMGGDFIYLGVDQSAGVWDDDCYANDWTQGWQLISFYWPSVDPGTVMMRGEGYY